MCTHCGHSDVNWLFGGSPTRYRALVCTHCGNIDVNRQFGGKPMRLRALVCAHCKDSDVHGQCQSGSLSVDTFERSSFHDYDDEYHTKQFKKTDRCQVSVETCSDITPVG